MEKICGGENSLVYIFLSVESVTNNSQRAFSRECESIIDGDN